jgi:hypothetical protein
MVRRRTLKKRRNLDALDKNGDICFDPPQTPATPPRVPIPYPNISMAKNTTKGSKKVKISGKMLPVKGSRFSKSEGDEAGTSSRSPSLKRVRKRSRLRRKK